MKKKHFLQMALFLLVISSFFVVGNVCRAEKAAAVIPGNAFIAKGTVLNFELMTEISSKTSKAGDSVQIKLLKDLSIDNTILIPKDTLLTGTLKKAQASKLAGQGAVIRILLDNYTLPNGITVILNKEEIKFKGDRSYTGLASNILLPFSGIFFKGKQVNCPAGMNFEYTVKNDIDLGISLDRLNDAAKVHM